MLNTVGFALVITCIVFTQTWTLNQPKSWSSSSSRVTSSSCTPSTSCGGAILPWPSPSSSASCGCSASGQRTYDTKLIYPTRLIGLLSLILLIWDIPNRNLNQLSSCRLELEFDTEMFFLYMLIVLFPICSTWSSLDFIPQGRWGRKATGGKLGHSVNAYWWHCGIFWAQKFAFFSST